MDDERAEGATAEARRMDSLDLVSFFFGVLRATRRLTMNDTLLFYTNTGLAHHESTFFGAHVATKFVNCSRSSC